MESAVAVKGGTAGDMGVANRIPLGVQRVDITIVGRQRVVIT